MKKVKTLADLNAIKEKYKEAVRMRDVGSLENKEITDVWILGGDNYSYEEISKLVKSLYDFYENKKLSNVRVNYKNLGFGDRGFDIKINDMGKKYFINDTDIDSVLDDMEDLYITEVKK